MDLATPVSVLAEPGGRTLAWSLDAAAVAAGVTLTPISTGSGARLNLVRITRPAGFVGTVVASAVDSVLGSVQATTIVVFQ